MSQPAELYNFRAYVSVRKGYKYINIDAFWKLFKTKEYELRVEIAFDTPFAFAISFYLDSI